MLAGEVVPISHARAIWYKLTFRGKYVTKGAYPYTNPYCPQDESERIPMPKKSLATCQSLQELPDAMIAAQGAVPEGVTVQDDDAAVADLARRAREVLDPAKKADDSEVVEVPDRIGTHYTAAGLARVLTAEMDREFTVDQVLMLDWSGKQDADAELKTEPGDTVSMTRVRWALKNQPSEVVEPSAQEVWMDILRTFLLTCSTVGVGEFHLYGERVFYRPTTFNRVWITPDALKVAYPSIDSTDHEILVVIPGAEHVNPEDLESVMDALDVRFTDDDGTRRDAWLVSKTYQDDLRREWDDDTATFWSEFNRAVGEVLGIPLSDSGRDYLARRIVSIQLLSGAVNIDDLLGLTPQKLIELDPHYVERPSTSPPAKQKTNIPRAPVVAQKDEVQSSDEAVDKIFDRATDAFLDVLEASGVFDSLSDVQIAAKFAEILK